MLSARFRGSSRAAGRRRRDRPGLEELQRVPSLDRKTRSSAPQM